MNDSQKTITRIPAAAERARLKDGVHIELSPRRVRAYFDDQLLVDSQKVLLVFETKRPPVYWFPIEDVRMDLLEPTATITQCPYKGNATYWSARIGDQVYPDIVWSYPFPIPECARIQNLLSFYNEKAEIYVDGELEAAPTRR